MPSGFWSFASPEAALDKASVGSRKQTETEPWIRLHPNLIRSLIALGYLVFIVLYGRLWWHQPDEYFSEYINPDTLEWGYGLYGSVFFLLIVFAFVQLQWKRIFISAGTALATFLLFSVMIHPPYSWRHVEYFFYLLPTGFLVLAVDLVGWQILGFMNDKGRALALLIFFPLAMAIILALSLWSPQFEKTVILVLVTTVAARAWYLNSKPPAAVELWRYMQ